jgi:bifunctional non-homologous end joining protein LigD
MKERLWKRVQEHAGPPPEALKKRPATQWVKPGVKLRDKHLRGDHSHIRHASLLGFSDEPCADGTELIRCDFSGP